MNKAVLIFLFFACLGINAFSQGKRNSALPKEKITLPENEQFRVHGTVVDGDTIPLENLRTVYIFDKKVFKNSRDEKKYKKLVRDVKKAYPYARLAGEKLKQYESMLAGVKNETEKKKIMKRVEADLKKEYGNELKNLTITQGRILLKLVDRETGNTSYELVQELRGAFSAFFWQSLARLFGSDLKSQYDKDGADQQIEDIILAIQRGQL